MATDPDRWRHGTVFSLFTGAGGLDCGLEAAGFETIACIENNDLCSQTLEINRSGWKQLDVRDVLDAATELRPDDLGLGQGELTVLAAGPPCQPFSVAGQWTKAGRRGMSDERAATVLAMLDLVERFHPKIVLIENVPGFLTGAVSAKPLIEARLEEINRVHNTRYWLAAQVVDAADHGVPQHRRRMIAVASRDGVNFKYPSASHKHKPVTAWEAIGDLDEPHPPRSAGGWSDLLPSIPEGANYQYLTSRGDGAELFGYRTRYWSFLLKLAKDRPSWTLPASPGPATGPFHWDNRPLSVRERLRLQSFPDDWQLAGRTFEQVRQAGNATPPLLAEVIGRALVTQLIDPGFEWPNSLRLLRRGSCDFPPPRPPAPVPDRYRAHIGSKTPHPGTGKGPAPREIASG